MVWPIVVRAVGDDNRQAVSLVPRVRQMVSRRLGSGVGRAWVIGRGLVEETIRAQRAIDFLDTGSFEEGPMDGVPSWKVDAKLSFEEALTDLPELVHLYFSRRMTLGRELRARLLEKEPRLVAWATDLEDPAWAKLDELAPDERAFRMSTQPYAEGG